VITRWSSRERVLAALSHEPPDRVPADLWAEPPVWAKLQKILGKKKRDEVCEAFAIDIRYIEPLYPPDRIHNGVRENMWGERWREADTAMGRDWQHIDGALAEAQSIEEIEAFPWPSCDVVDYSTLSTQCASAGECAIFYGNADFFERPALVRGLERFMIDTLDHPDWVEFLQSRFVEFFIEDFHRAMNATGGRIDAFLAMTDLGSQDRILFSPQTRSAFINPALKVIAETVHAEGVRLLFHSCGAIREIIPELIDCGVDILNPLQPGAKGMDPEGLKRDFGKDLVFHGGIDIQYLLPLESTAVVGTETRRRVEILGAEGGYILAPSHNLQEDIPVENIAAMYDVAHRC